MAPSNAALFALLSMFLVLSMFGRSASASGSPSNPSEEITDLIAGGLGSDDAVAGYRAVVASRVEEITERLRPILDTLPHDSAENFDAPAVRYALHHFFARSYGWRVHGLDPAGAAWNSTTLGDLAVLELLPPAAKATVTERLQRGLSESDIAVLAASIERLVQGEASQRLEETFKKLNWKREQPVSVKQALYVVEVYMTSFMLAKSLQQLRAMSKAELLQLHSAIGEIFPAWPGLRSFVHAEVSAQQLSAAGELSFAQLEVAVAAVGRGFGQWQQDNVCSGLKKSLVELEEPGTGRVLLSSFYDAGLHGQWQFQESADYLQKLGALDMSSPGTPRVIIANWVGARSNCIGSSGYHETCCISECEPLLASLERSLASPAAPAAEVERALSELSGKKELGPVMLHRLQVIASSHDGMVPIYGRLFQQAMHHVFPHECPFPHLSGTTKPLNVFEFDAAAAVVDASMASDAEMSSMAARKARQTAPQHSVPWTFEEELLVELPKGAGRPVGMMLVHSVVTLAAFAVLVLGMLRSTLRSALAKASGSRDRKSKGKVDFGLVV